MRREPSAAGAKLFRAPAALTAKPFMGRSNALLGALVVSDDSEIPASSAASHNAHPREQVRPSAPKVFEVIAKYVLWILETNQDFHQLAATALAAVVAGIALRPRRPSPVSKFSIVTVYVGIE